MTIKQISLYYKDGASDKVYHAQIEQHNDGYLVNFQYGRRGAALTAGTKTKDPVDLAKATKTFESLVKEKTAKGYTEGENGAVFKSVDLEDRITGIVPQLLNNLDEDQLEKYFKDDEWVMQEKFDGRRLMMSLVNGEVTAINKKGLAIPALEKLADLVKSCGSSICVDGELIGETYYIFDILEHNGENLREKGVKERYEHLLSIIQLKNNVVKAYFTEAQKRLAFAEFKAKEKEGVVFKKLSSKYVAGRPASGGNQLKYKFWSSATVEVVSHHKTKRSIGVAVYKDGQLLNMGNVTIPSNYDIPPVGELVEVIYLYCHVQGSLYQTKYKGVRDDQDKSDCSYAQIKFKAVDEDDEE